MKRLPIIFATFLLTTAFFLGTQSLGQTKYKGRLPNGWGKLGLSAAQKQQVYKVQTEYRKKIDALEAQIKTLKRQERGEMVKVLTDEQKERLTKLILGATPSKKGAKQAENEE